MFYLPKVHTVILRTGWRLLILHLFHPQNQCGNSFPLFTLTPCAFSPFLLLLDHCPSVAPHDIWGRRHDRSSLVSSHPTCGNKRSGPILSAKGLLLLLYTPSFFLHLCLESTSKLPSLFNIYLMMLSSKERKKERKNNFFSHRQGQLTLLTTHPPLPTLTLEATKMCSSHEEWDRGSCHIACFLGITIGLG